MNTPSFDNQHNRIGHRWQRDLNAGFSVAVIAIPQAIAYALIAQVPPEYGIYTLVIHALLGTLLNHNPLMAIGPTNTQSLLVASVLIHVVSGEPMESPEARGQLLIQLAVGLTLLKGIIQLILAGLRLGVLARYFSRSVILGFTAGAGALIAIGQAPAFLGLDGPQDYGSLPAAVTILLHVVGSLDAISWPAILISVVSVVMVVGCQAISRRMPGALLALLLTGAISFMFGWSGDSVPLVTWTNFRFPAFSLPVLEAGRLESLLGAAFALSVLGMVETYSISRSVAATAEGQPKPDREMAAQGLIHIVSSFFGCIPGSGSFARSAMNVHAGARTRYAGLISAIVVAVAFLVGSPLMRYIPLATLAGQLMVMSYALLNWRGLRQIFRADKLDGSVAAFTFLATLLLPLHYAIFAGVLLNLALYSRNIGSLKILELVPTDSAEFEERRIQSPGTLSSREITILQLDGDLFFGLADDLGQYFRRIRKSTSRVLLIRLKGVRSIDTTVLHRMAAFNLSYRAGGGHVLLSGVSPMLRAKLQRFGLLGQLGDTNVFTAAQTPFQSTSQALVRARQLASEA